MNPLANSSKWPSYESLASTPSIPLSESEQTEDEADVFSEEEGHGGIKRRLSVDEGIPFSGSYLSFPPNQLHSRPKRDQPNLRPPNEKSPDALSSPGAAEIRTSLLTPGDLAFAQKCADLHNYIHPLLDLLHGLKTGRFVKGLTSFQQSVAIDRLQRILGVLQRPQMGEKYLQNLLQIEMLLKVWFPREAIKSANLPIQSASCTLTSHWRQNQLHMPVKKRKLSWSDPHDAGTVPSEQTHSQQKHESLARHQADSLAAACGGPSPTQKKQATAQKESFKLHIDDRLPRHTVTDRNCLVSRWLRSQDRRGNKHRELPARVSPATQDCSVSSSNIFPVTLSP